jgi:hypothetical protein
VNVISTGDGVGSHSEEYGNNVKKAHIFAARISPKLPATKRSFATAGKTGMQMLATRPIIRDQKQMRGSTSKLVTGATRENLLKWKRSRGRVPSIAAAVSITPARSHLEIFAESP